MLSICSKQMLRVQRIKCHSGFRVFKIPIERLSDSSKSRNESSPSIKRPAGVRMGWSRSVISELLPFTSELISVRGRPLENIAVAYCVSTPVMDIEDPQEGQIRTQRRVQDSWLEMILPFSDQSLLRESMVRSDGLTIRFGKLFEILDALAADVAYRHCCARKFCRPVLSNLLELHILNMNASCFRCY